MNALRDVSKVWLVAKMVHTLFESILGNKVLEERLQKAAGRRHNKNKQNGANSGVRTAKNSPPNERNTAAGGLQPSTEANKRKFDDMELGYVNGPPAPQMSYERSRPQSPAMMEQAQPQPQSQQLPTISGSSPPMRQSTDTFMGTSRANTRPTTPFNTYSYPGTPPDLFLHTRGSPKISEDLWQNYDPGQLFPPEANGLFPDPLQNANMVDPALRGPSAGQQQHMQQPQQQSYAAQTPTQLHPSQAQQMPQMAAPMQPQQQQAHLPSYHQDPQAWAQMQAMQQQQRADDQWSNTSSTGPIVPTTLNVGDWFEFFGLPNGDIHALSAGAGLGGGGGAGQYG